MSRSPPIEINEVVHFLFLHFGLGIVGGGILVLDLFENFVLYFMYWSFINIKAY